VESRELPSIVPCLFVLPAITKVASAAGGQATFREGLHPASATKVKYREQDGQVQALVERLATAVTACQPLIAISNSAVH
jgi:hypothetical protein